MRHARGQRADGGHSPGDGELFLGVAEQADVGLELPVAQRELDGALLHLGFEVGVVVADPLLLDFQLGEGGLERGAAAEEANRIIPISAINPMAATLKRLRSVRAMRRRD